MYRVTSEKQIGDNRRLTTYTKVLDPKIILDHGLDIVKLASRNPDNEENPDNEDIKMLIENCQIRATNLHNEYSTLLNSMQEFRGLKQRNTDTARAGIRGLVSDRLTGTNLGLDSAIEKEKEKVSRALKGLDLSKLSEQHNTPQNTTYYTSNGTSSENNSPNWINDMGVD